MVQPWNRSLLSRTPYLGHLNLLLVLKKYIPENHAGIACSKEKFSKMFFGQITKFCTSLSVLKHMEAKLDPCVFIKLDGICCFSSPSSVLRPSVLYKIALKGILSPSSVNTALLLICTVLKYSMVIWLIPMYFPLLYTIKCFSFWTVELIIFRTIQITVKLH